MSPKTLNVIVRNRNGQIKVVEKRYPDARRDEEEHRLRDDAVLKCDTASLKSGIREWEGEERRSWYDEDYCERAANAGKQELRRRFQQEHEFDEWDDVWETLCAIQFSESRA